MSWRRQLSLIRGLFFRGKQASDLEEEIRVHVEMEEQENLESGLSPRDARAAALRSFGNTTRAQETSVEMWRWHWFESLLQDIRYALRLLRRSPGFAVTMILILAAGIGANTAIFSLMNAVMLKSLPVQEPERLVLFGDAGSSGSTDDFPSEPMSLFSHPFYRDIRQRNTVFSDVAAVLSIPLRSYGKLEGDDRLEPLTLHLVSDRYFSMLGVNPVLGVTFAGDDNEAEGSQPIAVASYSWWKTRYGGEPSVIGTKITIGVTVYTIVGVAPPEFFGTTVGESPDLWIPLTMQRQLSPGWHGLNDPMFQSLYILARLGPGVNMEQAEAHANVLYRQSLRDYVGPQPSKQRVEDIQRAQICLTPAANGISDLRRHFSNSLLVLMAVVALVLLIACANIANLLLARSRARQRETAIRMALGAGRARLIRQLVTECVLLGGLGGALGIALAVLADKVLILMVSGGSEPIPLNVTIDGHVLIFTLMVSVVTALLFGLAPALRATRLDVELALKDGRGSTSSRERSPLARSLVIVQVGLSLALLTAAGLFLRSLRNLTKVDTGFEGNHVLTFELHEAPLGYQEDGRLEALYQQIEERVSVLPGVRAAGISFFTFNQGGWTDEVWTQDGTTTVGSGRTVWHNVVGPGYFNAMGIPLVAGRFFGPQDSAGSPKVEIINEEMARTLFPGVSPIGRRFGLKAPDHSGDFEVIGVVKDAKQTSLWEKPKMADYFPHSQRIQYLPNLVVRSSADFASTEAAVRRTIHEIDPNLPVSAATTLARQVDRSLAREKMIARLSEFFAALAVFLACVGIYGLMSYAVSRRANEIGVRMALGATPGRVLRLILREIFLLVALGLALGSAVVLASQRLVSGLLFQVVPTEARSILAAMLLLLATAMLSGYLPARRASSIDPVIALRNE
jgi:predicted permease